MNVTVVPGKLAGTIPAIPSKSIAHRALICSAFASAETNILLDQTNADIEATADCLRALGATITRSSHGYHISPAKHIPSRAVLHCRESGSTLRFLLPVVGALGVDAEFRTEGRLGHRPLSPLWEEMIRMGCSLTRGTDGSIYCSGELHSGIFQISGNISSQFISGLLFAGALMNGETKIEILGNPESMPYIEMTRDVLSVFGITTENFFISSAHTLISPGTFAVEGDWSNAAFFLTAAALGSSVTVTGLDNNSRQGDRSILPILESLKNNATISAVDIPDLVPILSIAAAAKDGAVFTNIQRLRLKESDRVSTVVQMIRALGGQAYADDTTLTVKGTGLVGGTVDSSNDHRIAMAAAIAATVCKNPVTILTAEAVNKSYPGFWKDFQTLGGQYE